MKSFFLILALVFVGCTGSDHAASVKVYKDNNGIKCFYLESQIYTDDTGIYCKQ